MILIFLSGVISAEEDHVDTNSVTGCWISINTSQAESITDSIYNHEFYYVQFTMCLDEFNNIEINRKIKFDCCNEENKRFNGRYELEEGVIVIKIGSPAITEKYNYGISSGNLVLEPIGTLMFSSDLQNKVMLRKNWRRY